MISKLTYLYKQRRLQLCDDTGHAVHLERLRLLGALNAEHGLSLPEQTFVEFMHVKDDEVVFSIKGQQWPIKLDVLWALGLAED